MRGLIYRELYLMKKNLIIQMAICFGIFLLEMLVLLSCNFGNLSKLSDVDDQRETYFSLFLLVITIALFGTLVGDNNVTVSDFKAKWNMYSYTLPVSEYVTAGIKIGKLFVGWVVAFFFSVLNMLIEMAIVHEPFDILYIYYMLGLGLLFLLIGCVTIPLTLRFKNEKTAFGVIAVFYVALMFGISKLMGSYIASFKEAHPDLDEMDFDTEMFKALAADAKALLRTWGWTLPLLLVVVIAVSYVATVKMLKRRVV